MTKSAFEIDAKLFKAALKDVVDAVEARNTIPILSNVLLAVDRQALTITGTDMDVWVERRVDIETDDRFRCTVEAGILRRIVDKLPADAIVRFTIDDGKATVTAGRSRFQLPTLPADDFPALPRDDWDTEFEMQASVLATAIDTVAHAISTEETRFYLNGILLHAPIGAGLRFAATDGHRLARVVMDLPDGAEGLADVIVPRKVAKLVVGLLDRHEGLTTVRLNGRRVGFEIGAVTVQAKAIDGQYPDYSRVIPDNSTGLLTIDRAALIAAIGRVITVSSDKDRSVRCEIERDLLRVSVRSPEHGEGSEELPCSWSVDPLTIGFGAKYWLDTLGQMSADTVEGLFNDSAAPTLWRDREDAPAVFVLMPRKV